MKRAPRSRPKRRVPSCLAIRGSLPAFFSVLLLAGCAGVENWLHGFVGGEGKIAERVSPGVLDDPPIPERLPTTPELAVIPPTREEIVAVQKDLARLGYRPGPIDGFFGPLTVEAVKAYQKNAGRAPDGRITPELMDLLAAAARPEAAAPRIAATGDGAGTAVAPAAPRQAAAPAQGAVRPQPGETEAAVTPHAREKTPAPDTTQKAQLAIDVLRVEYAQRPPLYEVGDTFIWSNGRVEAVLRVFGEKVFWQVDNGMGYAADMNFLLPPASWSGPAGVGEAVIPGDAATFWPLRPQSSMAFEVVENGLRENWKCGVADIEHVSVPAGSFDSVVFSCLRDTAPPGEWTRRVWHYVPAIRHYVARTDFMPDGSRRSKELLGVRPGMDGWPPALKAGLHRAVQTALGTLPAGAARRWTSTGVAEAFEIRLSPVHHGEGQVSCRNFELVAISEGPRRLFPAVACRSGNEMEWTIPGDSVDPAGSFSFANFGG